MSKLEAFFLKRYIKAPKRNIFRFSFVFMILGIALSVSILFAGLNLFHGYEVKLKSLLLSSFSHISLHSSLSDNISGEEAEILMQELGKYAEVSFVIPVLQQQLMALKEDKAKAVSLNSFYNNDDTSYKNYVKQGKTKLKSREVIIGHYLAEELKLSLGDELSLMYPRLDYISAFGLQASKMNFKIVGIYRSGYYENDRSMVIADIIDTRSLLMHKDHYTKLSITLKHPDKAPLWAGKIENDLGGLYVTIPWSYYAQSLLRLVTLEKWLIFIVLSFLVLIAGINVISAVSTIIIDKSSEIASLFTMGAQPKSIRRIFGYQVGIVAIVAVIIGQLFGVLISWLVEKQGFYHLKGEVYFIDTLAAKITLPNTLIVFAVSSILIAFCIMIPLKQIQKREIIEILRENY